jgi:hypothetical protein
MFNNAFETILYLAMIILHEVFIQSGLSDQFGKPLHTDATCSSIRFAGRMLHTACLFESAPQAKLDFCPLRPT